LPSAAAHTAAYLEGRIEEGRIFDRSSDLADEPDGYRVMEHRESFKLLQRSRNNP
jgi:hypothetical protein